MKSLSAATFTVLMTLVIGSAGFWPRSTVAQVFAGTDYSGAELFMRYCAACHGERAVGDGPVSATLVTVVPDLTQLTARAGGLFPATLVAETIDGRSPVLAHGTRQMPVWGYEFWYEEGGDVTAETRAREMIAELLDYLESIQVD